MGWPGQRKHEVLRFPIIQLQEFFLEHAFVNLSIHRVSLKKTSTLKSCPMQPQRWTRAVHRPTQTVKGFSRGRTAWTFLGRRVYMLYLPDQELFLHDGIRKATKRRFVCDSCRPGFLEIQGVARRLHRPVAPCTLVVSNHSSNRILLTCDHTARAARPVRVILLRAGWLHHPTTASTAERKSGYL